jgi:hypothetical protein
MKIKKSVLKEVVREILLEGYSVITPYDLYHKMYDGSKSKFFAKYHRGSKYSDIPISLVFRHLKLNIDDLRKINRKGINYRLIINTKEGTFSVGEH